MEVRQEVHGDEQVHRAEARKDEFTEDFQEFITRCAWGGDVGARPGEIGGHVRAALRNGMTPEEIKEVILHSAIDAGVPAANVAFAVAQEAIAEDDAG